MKVDFSYAWYRQTCEENGFDPDNILSQSAIEVAKSIAIDMKRYMDENQGHNKELQEELDRQIKRLDNERIEFMLNALTYAEIMAKVGDGFNKFLIRQTQRNEHLKRG